jgi:superoxide reductase
MLKKKEIYRCQVCGNMVEGLWDGQPSVSCCGQPMTPMKVSTEEDGAVEKHVPFIKREGKKVTVQIGETIHPMTPEHYILFVELIVNGEQVLRHDFKEGDKEPVAVFYVDENATIEAREYCNIHGLWATAK